MVSRHFASLLRAVLASVTFALAGCDRSPASSTSTSPAPAAPEVERALSLIAASRFAEGRALLEPYIAEHPDHARAIFLLGLSHHRARDYAKARPYFERALALDPGEAVIHHFFGYCLYYLGDLEGARREFSLHLESDPDEADSTFGLGLVALDEGSLDEAERLFRRAIELTERLARTDPAKAKGRTGDLAKYHARLGDIHFDRAKYTDARTAYERAVALHPLHYPVYYRLSLVYRRLGEDALAEQALRDHEQMRRRAGR